jgi:urease accessory protein
MTTEHASPPESADAARLSLLRFSSQALPIGAFAYSRGMEYAVHAGWVRDEASACGWITGLLVHGVANLDAPIFARLHAALSADDFESVERWNAYLHASRESSELRLEDTQTGAALARLLVGLGVSHAQRFANRSDVCHATGFALMAVQHGIVAHDALLGLLFAWVEGQTSAAVRLIPLGQSAGQRILNEALRHVPGCVSRALALPDDEIGALSPRLAIGSALHETQYTRLFRS